MDKVAKEHLYYARGMHCASCEVLIEKKLLEIDGVKSVEANTAKGEVLIEYSGEKPAVSALNSLFSRENYVFSEIPLGKEKANWLKTTFISLAIISAFLLFYKLGFANWVRVNSESSLFLFMALGLVAGFSSCAALVGGIILSMSKQWLELYPGRKSGFTKMQPHLMFNAGRVVSYAFFGAMLGFLGKSLQISFQFTSFLVLAVSVLMIFLALQMLGVGAFRRFQFSLPKSVTRYIANENNFKGRYLPFIMGALTFFLPCGFTITAQGLALLSGNPAQASLIMTFFALGTAPALLLIGLSVVKFSGQQSLSFQFSKVAGIMVLFFALFNINSQLNVLGAPSLSNIGIKPIVQPMKGNISAGNIEGLVPIENGKQVLKMAANSSGYSPNYFKVKAGIPVRWEITDTGTSGCTNAIISRGLFQGQIDLVPGRIDIKEFTPTQPGKYKFSCWMGMISGSIEVVD